MIGRVVDGHQIVASLGRGGMGEVYLARSPSGEPRAYKILRGDMLQGTQAVARFRREVTLLGRLEHPGIVRILQTGQFEGGLYLAMEYVDGPDLQAAVDKFGPCSVADALKLLIQLAEALAFAHHRNVVHRDLKPANVLLAGGDPAHPKIIDFGLAKLAADEGLTRLTDDEQVLGSPLYLAPEQSSSSSVGPEADVYALGGLAYFALTGAPLFAPRSAVAMVYAHVHERPESLAVRAPDLELPAGFAALLAACVAKAPADRPSAAQLVVELAPLLARAPASRLSRPKIVFEATGHVEAAVGAQIRQVVLELAAILEVSTDVADQVQNELSELELELAMLDAEPTPLGDAAGDERHRRMSAHVAELRRGYEEALQMLTDAVLSRRATAPEEAEPLYGELEALFARYRSR
ncbi:MAG: serine/threonine-protein kinase [Kofleriaceae bacterium]